MQFGRKGTEAQAKPKKPRPPKEPITKIEGSALEAKYDQWRAERRTRRDALTDGERSHRRVMIQCASLGLALATVAGIAGSVSSDMSRQIAESEQSLQQLVLQKAEGRAAVREVASAQWMAQFSDRVTERANKVAKDQNRFAELMFKASKEFASDAGNGAPGEDLMKVGEHRLALGGDWAEGLLMVPEDDVPVYTSVPSFGADEIDPRYEWYVRYDDVQASAPDSYGWAVESVLPRVEDPLRASVVWVNRQKDGQVLAWARSTFDDEQQKFTSLQLAVTATGAAHQQQSVGEETIKIPELPGTEGVK